LLIDVTKSNGSSNSLERNEINRFDILKVEGRDSLQYSYQDHDKEEGYISDVCETEQAAVKKPLPCDKRPKLVVPGVEDSK
jgi:hypothetical protein